MGKSRYTGYDIEYVSYQVAVNDIESKLGFPLDTESSYENEHGIVDTGLLVEYVLDKLYNICDNNNRIHVNDLRELTKQIDSFIDQLSKQ